MDGGERGEHRATSVAFSFFFSDKTNAIINNNNDSTVVHTQIYNNRIKAHSERIWYQDKFHSISFPKWMITITLDTVSFNQCRNG